MTAVAIVPAAGRGLRLGADKALVRLGGETAIERLATQVRAAGIERLLVVRRAGADPLPAAAAAQTVAVDGQGEMADSLRAALGGLSAEVDRVVVCPVDHALVMAETFAALAGSLAAPDTGIALPVFRGRPGHPVALRRAVFAEIAAPDATLRDVIRRDPARVRAVPSGNRWVLADLDHPDDLRAAEAALLAEPYSVVEQMHRHRSRRAYRPEPLLPGQLERLVDAARWASTSSFLQAYAVVAVTDPERKAEAARLCADQRHIHEAPVFLAICADLHKIATACAQRGQRVQAQSLELFLQATVDAALLGQNLALAAESEGLGICMLGAARNHPVELARLLELPPHAFVVFGMTMGHPADDPVPRIRMPLPGVLHRERYDAGAVPDVLAGADERMREWARRVNREQGGYLGRPVGEKQGWADRMARMWGCDSAYARARAALREELRQLGFELR